MKTRRRKTKIVGFESLEHRTLLAADALLAIDGEGLDAGHVSAASVEVDRSVVQETALDVRGNPAGVSAARANLPFATAAGEADFSEPVSSPDGHLWNVETTPLTAEGEPSGVVAPWQNPRNPFDVNDDGMVSPIDALLIINRLNATGTGPLPSPTSENGPPPYLDVNGDNFLSPHDVLLVINHLNSTGSEIIPEGEGHSGPAADSGERSVPLSEMQSPWQGRGAFAERSRSDALPAADADRAAVLDEMDLLIESRRLDASYRSAGVDAWDCSRVDDRLEEVLSEIIADIGALWD